MPRDTLLLRRARTRLYMRVRVCIGKIVVYLSSRRFKHVTVYARVEFNVQYIHISIYIVLRPTINRRHFKRAEICTYVQPD